MLEPRVAETATDRMAVEITSAGEVFIGLFRLAPGPTGFKVVDNESVVRPSQIAESGDLDLPIRGTKCPLAPRICPSNESSETRPHTTLS